VTKYLLEGIQDYKQLFIIHKDKPETSYLTDSLEEKDFKKFLSQFTSPFFEEIRQVFKNVSPEIDSNQLAEALRIVDLDIFQINKQASIVRDPNLKEKKKQIVEEAIKRHFSN